MDHNRYYKLSDVMAMFLLVLVSANLSWAGNEGDGESSGPCQTHPRKRPRPSNQSNLAAKLNPQSGKSRKTDNTLLSTESRGRAADKKAQLDEIYGHLSRLINLVNDTPVEELILDGTILKRNRFVANSQLWFDEIVRLEYMDYGPILVKMNEISSADPAVIQLKKMVDIMDDLNLKMASWLKARKSIMAGFYVTFQFLESVPETSLSISKDQLHHLLIMAHAWLGQLQAHVDHSNILTSLTTSFSTQDPDYIISTLENLIYSHPSFTRDGTFPVLNLSQDNSEGQPQISSPAEVVESTVKLPPRKRRLASTQQYLARLKDIQVTCSLTPAEFTKLGNHAGIFAGVCRDTLIGILDLHDGRMQQVGKALWLKLNELFFRLKWIQANEYGWIARSIQELGEFNQTELIHFVDEFSRLFKQKNVFLPLDQGLESNELILRFNQTIKNVKVG